MDTSLAYPAVAVSLYLGSEEYESRRVLLTAITRRIAHISIEIEEATLIDTADTIVALVAAVVAAVVAVVAAVVAVVAVVNAAVAVAIIVN